MNPEFENSLVLAYLGDSIIELMVREYLIRYSGVKKVNELYRMATYFVSSKAHHAFIHYCLDHDLLTEKEVSIFKRGRNTKGHKNESVEHKSSTGFEALIGYLYLNEEKKRIEDIFDIFIRYVDETNVIKK